MKSNIHSTGTHIIADIWCKPNLLTKQDFLEHMLLEAVEASGSTVLHSFFHVFSENDGITGILALAESHISIHTWPEYSFAAVDIYMCGQCFPEKALKKIEEYLVPEKMSVKRFHRGKSKN